MDVSNIDGDSFLGTTSIKPSHVERAFREFVNDSTIRLTKIASETIGVGQGFTSYVLRLSLTWREEDVRKHTAPSLPKSAILKALHKDSIDKLFDRVKLSDEQTSVAKVDFSKMVIVGHKTECVAYELMGKKLGTSPPVPMVLAFATWIGEDPDARPPLILLEDLGDRARVLGDGTASLNLEQAMRVAEAQADLHAWSWTTDEPWRDKFPTAVDRAHVFAGLLPMMLQGLRRAKESDPDAYGKLDEAKVMALMDPENMKRRHIECKNWMPEVLVHGDFWANNIMFNKLPDGSMGDQLVAIIDWQMPFVGNPMVDLGRILSISFDAHLRDTPMKDLIKRYYDRLVKKVGDRMPSTLTFEKVLAEAEKQTAISCLIVFLLQDIMRGMFVSGDGPEAEEKLARLIRRNKDGVKYATKHLDISTDK